MAEGPRNVLVLFPIVLITLINPPTGKCSDKLPSVTGEGNLPSLDLADYITWNGNGSNKSVAFNIKDSTELVRVNDTEWPSRNESVLEKISSVGEKVKGFFDNLTSGRRKKRSVPEKYYINRKEKLWRSLLEEKHGYGQYKAMNNRRQVPRRWYGRARMGNEKVAGKIGRYTQPSSGYKTFPQSPKPPPQKRNRYLPTLYKSYDPTMHSVKIFKQMNSKLTGRKRKTEGLEREDSVQREIPEIMNINMGSETHPGPQSQYKCKVGTNGLMSYEEGRTMSSRGLTYSEEDSRGIRTLICKAETSDVYQPDPDIFLKNTVTGLNVVTNDHDPFKFLEKGNEIDNEALEIGSQSGSELSYSSVKNQSMSSVSTQGAGAHSQTKVNTKFVYEDGLRTSFESAADVEGSTTFNATEGHVPVILTSRKEESSSVLQNPDEFGVESAEDENVATFMNHRKKIDFDVAFRNLFDY